MSDGSGDKGGEIGKFWHTCSVGNFLNKISSPAGLDESHVFDIDGRLHGETSSTCSEELQSDFNTWLADLEHAPFTVEYSARPSVVLCLTPWNSSFRFHFPACTEPQIPRPHTTSTGFRSQSLSWVRFYPIFSWTYSLIHTHMHILYFAMNMMKGRERKVKAPREQTDPGFYLKSLCFSGSWDFGFGVSAQFERSSCLLLVEKGGEKEPLPCLFALICCSRGRVCGWPKPRWHVSVQPQDEGCLIYKWNV